MSDFFDDFLGLDPNGGGLADFTRTIADNFDPLGMSYNAFTGRSFGDDVVGADPGGGGAVKAANIIGPLVGAYFTGGALAGAYGSGAGAAAGAGTGATEAGIMEALAAQGIEAAQLEAALSAAGVGVDTAAALGSSGVGLGELMASAGVASPADAAALGTMNTATGVFEAAAPTYGTAANTAGIMGDVSTAGQFGSAGSALGTGNSASLGGLIGGVGDAGVTGVGAVSSGLGTAGGTALGATATDMAAAAASGMSIADYMNLAKAGTGIVSGLNGLIGGGTGTGASGTATAAADPFASSRAGYVTKLNNLVANPDSITNTAAYKSALNQGLTGVQRTMASRGYANSGNEQAALMDYGNTYANNQYQTQLANLMQLSGAVQSPAQGLNAATNATTAANAQQQQYWNALAQGMGTLSNNSQAIGNLGNTIGSWWSSLTGP